MATDLEAWAPALYSLNLKIFKESLESQILHRLKNHSKILLLTAGSPEDLWGYKLGYESTPDTFYSWLGAVAPAHRQKGLARALMDRQHAWCQKQGYKSVQTKTLHKWENMLKLNLAVGFNIVDTYVNKQGLTKILLEKKLC